MAWIQLRALRVCGQVNEGRCRSWNTEARPDADRPIVSEIGSRPACHRTTPNDGGMRSSTYSLRHLSPCLPQSPESGEPLESALPALLVHPSDPAISAMRCYTQLPC
eukprot:6490416-Amphidinium_carterae.5